MAAIFAVNLPGMESIPLVLLLLGLGFVFSVVAVATAFCSRSAARIFSLLACSAAGAVALIILTANKGDLSWFLHLLTDGSLPILLLYATVLLSIVAALIPLARRATDESEGKTVRRNRWLVCLFVAVPFLTLVGLFGMRLMNNETGARKTQALLSGDRRIQFERIEINYHQIRVICTDPSVLRYLEECFHQHAEPHHGPSTTYEMILDYEGGGRGTFITYWHEGGFSLALSADEIDHGIFHGVQLRPPVPAAIEEIARFLNDSGSEDKGTVLIVEKGSIRRQHN